MLLFPSCLQRSVDFFGTMMYDVYKKKSSHTDDSSQDESAKNLPEWNLSQIYPSPSSSEFMEDKKRFKELAKDFVERYRNKVNTLSATQLNEAFKLDEEIYSVAAKLSLYAYLSFASDTSSEKNQSLLSEIEELSAEVSSQLVFFDLELGQSDTQKWLTSQELAPYHYSIQLSSERGRYNLTEELEAYGIEKNLTGRQAAIGLFDEFLGSFRFEDKDYNGNTTTFTQESALSALHHHDRSYRLRIYEKFMNEIGNRKVVLANIYNNIMLDHKLDTKRRGYNDLMAPRNSSNQVSMQTVESMLATVESGYPIAQRYFKLKSEILHYDDFTNADIYAPITNDKSSKQISFAQAKDAVSRAYQNFDEEAGEIIRAFYTEQRLDAPPHPDKRSGAFCYGASAKIDAFVLLNFTGEIRSVQTLAHELGHGLHHQLAKRNNNHTNFNTPLTTAETASIFGEMLLNELLYQEGKSPIEKLSLLCSQMEGAIATVFRQTVLTRFEQRSHKEREKGRLSADRLCEIWWEENHKLYGDAVRMVEPYRWGWAYIPHFIHTPFYCYAYSFAQLLVLALYREYQKLGDSFKKNYLLLLSKGGSNSPSKLIQECLNVDIEEPSFWEGALHILEETLLRIEEEAKVIRNI